MDSSSCFRIQNTLPQLPTSVAGSCDCRPGRLADGANGGGNPDSNFQGCHFCGESLPTSVHFNSLSSGERTRDRRVSPCDQPKGAKQISSEGEVQNGGATYCSLSSSQRRLYDETRLEGRLLCSPDTSRVEKISSFPVQGNNLRVLLPPIRPLPGSSSLHQDPPSDCCQTAFRRDTNSHLLGRPSPDPSSEGHIEQDFPLCAESFVQPGFHSETGEMLSGANLLLSLPGGSSRHNLHVSFPARGTDQSDSGCMPRNARVPVNISGWTVKPLGPHEPCRTDGTVDSTIILQSPATPAGSASPPVRMETKVSDILVSTLPGGPEMVGVLSSARSQQPGHHSSSVRPFHQDRCILTGLGCNLQRDDDRGTLEHGGSRTAHQLFGAQGSHSSFEGIPESRNAATIPVPRQPCPTSYPSGDGQYNCRGLCEQEGGHSVTISVPIGLGTVVLPADPRVMADSPSLTGSVECGSRRSFEGIQHAHRVDASEGCLSGHSTSLLCSGDRPVCVAFEPSAASLCVATSRPRCLSGGRLSTGLEAVEEFHPPTSGVTSTNSSESEKRQSNGPTSSPRLARSTLVCSDSTNADRYTIPTSQGEGTIVSAFRPGSSPPAVAVSQPDCMADIGSAFRAAGFPEEVTNVLLTSWSQSTEKRYQGPWRAWSIWCSSRGLCPFSAPVADVLTFLTETVTNKSLEYRTLAVYKSAISQGHLPVGQTKLGDLPVVSRFMKGIFRMKSPTPRLSSTWDVKHLLDFLATLDPPAGLTLKMLSLKLAALLALTSSARAHELIKLDLDFVSIKGDSWEFSLAEHTKVSRPGHPARKIYLPAFPDNPKICVVKTLQEYRSRTENRRQSSRLLISFVRPFKPISSQTMSRWLRKIMQLAGIACHFTGHSTRSASTSAAARAGVPLDTILVAADWSSSESFKRFYLRSPDKGEFARAVLTGVPE